MMDLKGDPTFVDSPDVYDSMRSLPDRTPKQRPVGNDIDNAPRLDMLRYEAQDASKQGIKQLRSEHECHPKKKGDMGDDCF